MNYASTWILRFAIICLGAVVVLFASFLLPNALIEAAKDYSQTVAILAGVGMYGALLPFLFALYQGMKLLNLIDKNKTFTTSSVKAFAKIKYAAIVAAVLFAGSLPLFYSIADTEDAPGVMVIGLAVTCVPFAFGIFAAVMQRLFKNAVAIKKENDLTV